MPASAHEAELVYHEPCCDSVAHFYELTDLDREMSWVLSPPGEL